MPEIDEDTWKESSRVLPGELLKDPNAKVDVFLVLQSEFLEDIFDAAVIRNLVRHARMYTWGSDIYVVLDQSLDRKRGQLRVRIARERYLAVLEEEGVVDVLEARVQDEEIDKIPGRLFTAVGRSLNRRAHLETLAAMGEWRCYVNQPPATVSSFLEPFRDVPPGPSKMNYLLVPLEPRRMNRGSINPENFISRVLEENPRVSFAVAHIDKTSVNPPDELKRLCTGGEHQFLEFRGLFELHYFLKKLAALYKIRVPRLMDGEEAVRLHETVRFNTAPPPAVLITHSFVPTDDIDQCSEAARDAYEIIKQLPANCEVVIHPAINCEILPDVVEHLRHLSAWVHIGHGESAEGLRESGDAAVFKSPDQWLECFLIDEERGRSLALACFACCQSSEAARLFATAGAQVAVGFTADVELNLCRAMAKEIVGAAVRANGDRGKILSAFRRGRGRINGITKNNPKATAFCSGH